jgi:hypothetical protein
VLIEPTLENTEKAQRAVGAWGLFDPDYEPADFISGDILSFGGLLRVQIHVEPLKWPVGGTYQVLASGKS